MYEVPSISPIILPSLLFPGWHQNVDRRAGGLASPTANVAYATFYLPPVDDVITGIEIYVGTASGNVNVALLTSDGTNFTKVASSGSTLVVGSSAKQRVPFTSTYRLTKNVPVWMTLAFDNSTVTVIRLAGTAFSNAVDLLAMTKSTNFALATPDAILNWAGSAFVPAMRLY